MNRSHEIRIGGSSPGRPYLSTSSSLSSSFDRDEIKQRGYLNRKIEGTLGRKNKVLHRDRNWQLFWCNLKGTQLELYKVDGIRVKPGDPPPKDVYPPTNLSKNKLEYLNIDGALVELDYVSQENKDIQKRRKFLFRIATKSDTEYFLQAPSEQIRENWVFALQGAAKNLQIDADDSLVGHAIKTSRDSIKHTSKYNVQRIKHSAHKVATEYKPALLPMSVSSGQGTEESDYIEFSAAEAMVAAGGDPRLQALRKRLQAKKELLKQLDRMYSSFLGGNAAAMYDESLILQQIEPPTFNNGSPILSTGPSNLFTRRSAKKNTYQVVHRKLTLNESGGGVHQAKSMDNGINSIQEEGKKGVAKERVEDRRASTGEMNVPAVITSVSPPLPEIRDTVVQTELLRDYYLVPGAEWSLLKKGEVVQIIGKAKETGWYRCMALREAKIELDKSTFPFLVRSMINLQSSSKKNSLVSGITPEMIEEEYSMRDLSESLSSDTYTEAFRNSIVETGTPPPIIPRHLSSSDVEEELFTSELDILSEKEDTNISLVDSNLDSITYSSNVQASKRSSSEQNLKETSAENKHLELQRPKSNESLSVMDALELPKNEKNASSGEDVARKSPNRLSRSLSYLLATGEVETFESYISPKVNSTEQQRSEEKEGIKKVTEKSGNEELQLNNIKRSTSFTPAAVKLRESLNATKSPRAASTSIGGYHPSASPEPLNVSSSVKDYSLKNFSSPKTRLDHLIEKEFETGTYPSPLIGCIPPSALKCFAEGSKDKLVSSSLNTPSPLNTPTHSPSDGGGSGSGSNSRPISDQIDLVSENSTSQKEKDGLKSESKRSVEEEETNDENTSTTAILTPLKRNPQVETINRGFSISVSMDDDSDGEADRRQAILFKANSVITPEEDKEFLMARNDIRAKSLPPPAQLQTTSKSSPAGTPSRTDEDADEESSLDHSPSHLRRKYGSATPEPIVLHPPSYSVGSSPLHKPMNSSGNGLKSGGNQNPPPISALFESSGSNKTAKIKKFFTRSKNKPTKLNTPESVSGRVSPALPSKGMLKQVLLGNQDILVDSEGTRVRVSSVSGRPVHQKGVAIVIGDESSSESEGEEENSRQSDASSFQEESPFSSHVTLTHGQSAPTSPTGLIDPTQKISHFNLDHGKVFSNGSSKLGEIIEVQAESFGILKRSASEHDSITMKANLSTSKEQLPLQSRTTTSLKRNMAPGSIFSKKNKKSSPGKLVQALVSPADSPIHQPSKKNKLSMKRKKRPISVYDVEKDELQVPGATDQDPTIKISGIFRQPPRGEKRYVYLDPSEGRFGFRLQSYGLVREQGKVLQTFVQSVNPGSPSFMAGLYPGDAIVEVNGVDVKYAPVESVVKAIQEGTFSGERVTLKVEFVDGVTRLDYMQKADKYKNEIKSLQGRLKKLLASETNHPLTSTSLTSPQHILLAKDLPVWAETTPTFEPEQNTFPFNRHLNEIVAVHRGDITALECDVLIMPISSCHKEKNKNLLLQLLRAGGPGLLDDLSLAKQCKIGENIRTWGHRLQAKYIYHCVFGELEESLQSCCYKAMALAVSETLRTVVFWLDGFASLSVSPHIIIEAVRNWLQQDPKRNMFDRVVFSFKANSTLIEKLMHNSFPLLPFATQGDMHTNKNGTEPMQNGTEPTLDGTEPNQNEEQESTSCISDGMDMDHEMDENQDSTEKLLESLQAIQEETMKTFEELVKITDRASEKDLESTKLRVTSPQSVLSRSLPGKHYLDDNIFEVQWMAKSVSPSHRRSQSEDMVLNPDRVESDV